MKSGYRKTLEYRILRRLAFLSFSIFLFVMLFGCADASKGSDSKDRGQEIQNAGDNIKAGGDYNCINTDGVDNDTSTDNGSDNGTSTENGSDINTSTDNGSDLSASDKNESQPIAVKNEDITKLGIGLPLEESKVIDLKVESGLMGRKMPCKVYLPKGYGGGEAYPVWYGLHGYSSDESMWLNQVGIGEASDKFIESGEIKPMIMVFPYTKDATLKEINKDMEDDGKLGERNMDRFICEELVPYIDSRYDTVILSEGRYIGGFSMGGMIAIRIAFHHPDMFSKVGGYSAAMISADYSDRQLEEWLFPYDSVDKIPDIVSFDEEKGLDKLTVYLDCGTNNDPFLEGLESLYDALQKRGIKSEFHEYNGGHDLVHVTESVKEHLEFYVAKN